jgi:hypothetical protein
MSECRFSPPVLVRVAAPEGFSVQAIEDPRVAMTAMSRGAVGGFHLEWPGYAICLEKLGRAVIDPRPETLEAARQAFCHLAERVGALVGSDDLSRFAEAGPRM